MDKFSILRIFIAIQMLAGITFAGALSVVNLNVNPAIITAGSNVTLTFQLYDSYTRTLSNVNLYASSGYPLLNVSPSTISFITSIGQGIYGGSTTYFKYKLHIPSDVNTGTYVFNISANYQTDIATTTGSGTTTTSTTEQSIMPILLYIRGNPEISATASSISPQLDPGSSSQAVFTLYNTGGGDAKNVSVTLHNTKNISVVGTATQFIGSIAKGSSQQVSTSLIASQNLVNDTYVIPITVRYSSDYGENFTYNSTIPISVAINQPRIVIQTTGANPAQLLNGYNQTLYIAVENVGTGAARNVTVAFTPDSNVEVQGSVNKFFIGTIPAGSSSQQTLLIFAKNGASNATIHTYSTYYADNYRALMNSSQNLELNIEKSAQFKITSESSLMQPGSSSTPLRVTIQNTGNIAASGIQLSLQTTYPIAPVDGNAYLDQLAPGQSATILFLVNVDSNGEPASYPITVYETWKQNNSAPNQQFSGSQQYSATINSAAAADIGSVYTFVIAVAAIAIIYFRFKKKIDPKIEKLMGIARRAKK